MFSKLLIFKFVPEKEVWIVIFSKKKRKKRD